MIMKYHYLYTKDCKILHLNLGFFYQRLIPGKIKNNYLHTTMYHQLINYNVSIIIWFKILGSLPKYIKTSPET